MLCGTSWFAESRLNCFVNPLKISLVPTDLNQAISMAIGR
jgi:hypothetical protein